MQQQRQTATVLDPSYRRCLVYDLSLLYFPAPFLVFSLFFPTGRLSRMMCAPFYIVFSHRLPAGGDFNYPPTPTVHRTYTHVVKT